MRPMRRPGADVQAIQLTARALPAIRSELAARDIHHEVHHHDGHLLLHSERGPRPLRWGDWLVVESDGFWDVYGNSVIEGWVGMGENDEPCMCGTPFTCMADVHDYAVANQPRKVIVLHMVYPDGTHTGDCEGCLWAQSEGGS